MIHRYQLTCAQFVELADAYALEALDELEQRACARHIGRSVHHAGCRDALASARLVMDRLASALPGGAPPAALWDAIEARLGAGPGSRSSDAEWL